MVDTTSHSFGSIFATITECFLSPFIVRHLDDTRYRVWVGAHE